MKTVAMLLSLCLISSPLFAREVKSFCAVSYEHSSGKTVLHTVGVGFEPKKRNLSGAQKRLMAQRAAMLQGYKNLFHATAHFHAPRSKSPFQVEVLSGFLKGVEMERSRFFSDGKVEVDMHLTLEGQPESFQQVEEIFMKHSVPVYEINQEQKYISKEEYENLFRQ